MRQLQCLLVNNTCYANAMRIIPRGIVVHSTGANNKTIKRYVQPTANQIDRMGGLTRAEMLKLLGTNICNNHWNFPGISKCVHAFIGTLADGSVATVQTLPWAYRPWGCGTGSKGSYNNSHIQFEICEDNLKDKAYFNAVYKEATELCAHLCRYYSIPINKIVSHAEAHKLGYASNHADIDHWLKKFGKTMGDFRAEVSRLLNELDNKSGQNHAVQSQPEFKVKVTDSSLNIRTGPGTDYPTKGAIQDKGVYTIVETQNGWGKLKSGAGWINLKYTKTL